MHTLQPKHNFIYGFINELRSVKFTKTLQLVCISQTNRINGYRPLDWCPSGPAGAGGAWPCSSQQPPAHQGAPRWTPTTAGPVRSPDCGSTGRHGKRQLV